MKRLIATAVLLLGLTATAQTNTSTIDTNALISGPGWKVIEFLGHGTNWVFTGYGIYAPEVKDRQWGGGIAASYKLSDFVAPTLRVDYLDEQVWMPSGSVQLQLPLRLAGKVDVIPFTFAGVATPISGRGADNGTAVGIFGVGAAVRIAKHWDLVYDVEKWTGFDGLQHRFGVLFKF